MLKAVDPARAVDKVTEKNVPCVTITSNRAPGPTVFSIKFAEFSIKFAELDKNTYPLAKKVSNNEMKKINLHFHEINGRWNYTITPSSVAKN